MNTNADQRGNREEIVLFSINENFYQLHSHQLLVLIKREISRKSIIISNVDY